MNLPISSILHLFFQELWNNNGIDAVERIKNIEEGMEYDIEVIRHSSKTLEYIFEYY